MKSGTSVVNATCLDDGCRLQAVGLHIIAAVKLQPCPAITAMFLPCVGDEWFSSISLYFNARAESQYRSLRFN